MANSDKTNKIPKAGQSILFRLTVAATIAPILIVIVVGAATVLRLRAEAQSVGLSRASLGCSKVSGKLRTTRSHDREKTISRLEEARAHSKIVDTLEQDLDVRIGLYRPDSDSIQHTEIEGLSVDVVALAKRGSELIEYNGEIHGIAAARIPNKGDAFYVAVLARPPSYKSATLLGAFRFSIVAMLVLFGAALFGAAKGFEFSDYFAVLSKRMEALLGVSEPRSDRSISKAPRSQDAANDFDLAFSLVEEGFRGELAMYRDAVDEVQTLDARRTEFLGNLSSDLHEPLVQVLNHTKCLLDGDDGPLEDSQAEDVRIVATAGKRLMRIVEDVLDLSSLIYEGIVYDDEPVDLTEVAREVIETAKGGLGKKELKLSVNCDEGVTPFIKGSRQRMWQILTNLVGNAVKFTDAGTVAVRLGYNEEGRVFVDVSDTGVGISGDYMEDIFDPFKQRGELSKKLRGTGLGLAICKRLVELHDGEIQVTSTKAVGSCFTVILPGAK